MKLLAALACMLTLSACLADTADTIVLTAEAEARRSLETSCQVFRAEALRIDQRIDETPAVDLRLATLPVYVDTADEATARCERINETTSPGLDAAFVSAKTSEILGLEQEMFR